MRLIYLIIFLTLWGYLLSCVCLENENGFLLNKVSSIQSQAIFFICVSSIPNSLVDIQRTNQDLRLKEKLKTKRANSKLTAKWFWFHTLRSLYILLLDLESISASFESDLAWRCFFSANRMWWYWQTSRGLLYICSLLDTCVRAMRMSPSNLLNRMKCTLLPCSISNKPSASPECEVRSSSEP